MKKLSDSVLSPKKIESLIVIIPHLYDSSSLMKTIAEKESAKK